MATTGKMMVTSESSSTTGMPAKVPMKRHALFFFAGCFMGRTDGCHVRAMQTLDLLIAAGLDVTIYSYRKHPDWPWMASDVAACAERFPSAGLVLDDGGSALRLVGRAKTALSLLGPRLRNTVLRMRVPGLTPALDILSVEHRPDLLVASYATGLSHINGLPDARIVVDMHDVTSLERVRMRSPGSLDWGALWALRKELGLLGIADAIWAISYAESFFLQEMLGHDKVILVPPTVDLQAVPINVNPEFDLLFIGSDNRWNAAALLDFLNDFASWDAGLTLAVAGKVSLNSRLRERARDLDGVQLLGFQNDLARLYRRARAAICPVEGTGTKIKVVEALAAARPVFVRPGALRGLAPGYHDCVFSLDRATVTEVLRDPVAVETAAAAARTYARHYAFDTVLERVNANLQELLPSGPTGRGSQAAAALPLSQESRERPACAKSEGATSPYQKSSSGRDR
jgi:glycosyltransferase involved in cell wall biosynthesis